MRLNPDPSRFSTSHIVKDIPMRPMGMMILGVLVILFVGLMNAPYTAQGAAFTVISTNDSFPGSLRQAILDANASPGTDRITFNIPGAGFGL